MLKEQLNNAEHICPIVDLWPNRSMKGFGIIRHYFAYLCIFNAFAYLCIFIFRIVVNKRTESVLDLKLFIIIKERKNQRDKHILTC